MIKSKKQSIEDIIVETLAENPYTEGPVLVELIKKKRPKTSKQAVYIALKTLSTDEIVAKIGSKYFLSRLWLNKISKLFEFQKENEIIKDVVFKLKDKESISYRFPSLLTCDTYWAHSVNLLIDWLPPNKPVFIWNPHNIFVIGREEVEEDIFRAFEKDRKYGFYVTRGKTLLDKEFKKTWTSKNVSIHTDDNISFEDNYYLNIFDNFIIEVFISKELAQEIDTFYAKDKELSSADILFFKNLLSEKYPVRMKISRNKTKADRLRKKLAKHFFIPKDLVI